MNLFDTLERKQKHTEFNSGPETRFFVSHFGMFSLVPAFKNHSHAQKPFEIIRANVILRALMNKKEIEETFFNAARLYKRGGELTKAGKIAVKKAVDEVKANMPYMELGRQKIYVPILGRSLNSVYDNDIFKLEDKLFRAMQGGGLEALVVDPFDTYGYALFDSYFTNLICVKQTANSAAFFDYDSLSIYIVNAQGRLDVQICLFDRQIGKRNTNHMMERLLPVVDAYYRDDREGFKQTLVENELISSRLMYRITSDENKHFSKIDRRFERKQ